MQPNTVNESANASTSQSLSLGWLHWLTFLLLLGTAAWARFYCLACKLFWFDEAFSVEVARTDWRNFLHLMWWREANMSLYYLLLRIWFFFGHSPFFIRSLSAVISIATLPAIYWVGRLLYNQRVALTATALFAFNAYSIRYAQEARSYALFVLLATISSGFFVSFLTTPTRRNWIGYIVLSTLAVYAHFYALLLVTAHWLTLQWGGIPGSETEVSAESPALTLRRAWIIIGVAVSPLLIFVAKTGAGPIKWISRPGITDLWNFANEFTNRVPLIYFAGCLLALISWKGGLSPRERKWDAWRVRFLLVWLLFPILLTLLLSFARPVFLARYVIFCIPSLLILVASGLERFRPHWLGGIFVFLVLVLSAKFVPFVYNHDFDDERDASGAATNFILDHSQPGDAIIFHIAESRVPYEFFRSLRAEANTPSPDSKKELGPEILFPSHGVGLNYQDFTGKPTEQLARSAAEKHSCLWLMLMNNGTSEKPDPTTIMLTRVLPESLPKMQRWQFARVEVRLYSRQ